MTRRQRSLLGFAIAALAVAGFVALVYRMYAPGSLADRIATAQARWGIFGQAGVWRYLARGLLITVELASVSIAMSLVFGVLLALVRLAVHPRMRAPLPAARLWSGVATVIVEAIRSSPLFMLIIYTFIAVPKYGPNLSPFASGVVALTLYTSCVLSEIFRAGILSLDRGQFEAAEALGLRYGQRLRFVVLPQGLRRMVPAIVSQLVTLIKDTSLVSVITVFELARRGQALSQLRNNPIETAIVVMSMYFVVNFTLSELSRRLELRPGRVGRAKAPAVVGAEDQVA